MRRFLIGCAGVVVMLAGAAIGLYGAVLLPWGFDGRTLLVALVLLAVGVGVIFGGLSIARRADRFAKPS